MSTYSTNLKLELITTGTQAGTWGDTTNTNLGTLLEQAISGVVTQAMADADQTITIPDGASGVARNMFIECTGALTAARSLIVPTNKKLYFVSNATTGGFAITVKVSGQTGVSVPMNAKVILVMNSAGTDIVVATNYMSALSLGAALPVTSGGTGVTTSTGSGANVLGTSPTIATPSISSPTLTGTPVAPTASPGTNTTQIATTAFVTAAATSLATIYPIGSIYTSTVSTNPATLFGIGTWVAFGAGRVLLGDGGGYAAGATGGSADAITVSHTHTATTSSTDSGHSHGISPGAWTDGGGKVEGNSFSFGGKVTATQSSTANITSSTSIASTGSSGTGANLQPYIVVYMWNRTA
jgi:hypothetical protein